MAMTTTPHIYTPITTKPITTNTKRTQASLALFQQQQKTLAITTRRIGGCGGMKLTMLFTSATAVKVEGPTGVKKGGKELLFRVGHGFDLHRLEPGYPLIIGGIDVPHDRGCEAHSDGDVLLHCVVDAILGALGLPDIGQIFPDSDPKWKGAPSSVFIKEAVRLMDEAGYEIGNLDATLILQRPKLSPLKEKIRTNLSELLGADPSVVNLKGKTHEKVDSLGENRSIAAHTVVLLMKK